MTTLNMRICIRVLSIIYCVMYIAHDLLYIYDNNVMKLSCV